LLESLDIFNESADVEWQARVLNNLGVLHLEIDEPERALTYLTSGLDLARQHHLTFLLGELLDSACNAYCALDEYNKALKCGLESIACYREVGASRGESKALNSVGDVYQAQGKFDQALQAHTEALELASAVDFKFEIIEALLHIGQIYQKTGRTSESLTFFEQALEMAQEINARQKIYTSYRSLAEAHKQLGNYKEALEYFEKFQTVERSVFDSRADNRLKSLQVMHQLKDARHQAEISRLSNVELQRQINEREQLISDLEAFSHMVAHDLRNPLASIMMSLSMLDELKSKELGPDGREYLRIARNMADRMAAIIRELLVLASVRQKDVTLVVVDMGEITKSALDILSFQIEQTHAKIIMPDEWPQVFGYPAWIEEIWTNYISNALKYGGSPPIVRLGYTRLKNGRIRFWVRDNGDGISSEEQDRLFTPFSQLDRKHKSGYGLGLSIVQRIAIKLNGEVGVESSGKPGEGSTFYFTLPGMIELP
jgi:signal transduction histidine kinase